MSNAKIELPKPAHEKHEYGYRIIKNGPYKNRHCKALAYGSGKVHVELDDGTDGGWVSRNWIRARR